MKEKQNSNKTSLIETIRNRIDHRLLDEHSNLENITDEKIAVLVGELQIAQLELEMQSDELLASSQLLESERAKFEGFFELAPVGYFILDRLGIIEESNRVGANLLAINQFDSIGKRFQSFVSPEDWENFYSFLHKMQLNDGKQTKEIRIALSNGGGFYTRMEGIAVTNAFTNTPQYYITVIDISESRQAQQKLLETTQRLKLTLSSSGTGTWTIDLSTNKVFIDEYCYSLFEINLWEYDGTVKGLIALIHPEDRQKVKQELITAASNFKNLILEFRVITKDGRVKVMAAQGHQVANSANDKYYAGILRDITERERIAKKKQTQFEERQKLILSTAFNAQEKERHKISASLHDSVCQLLYGVRLNLQRIQIAADFKEELKNVNQLLDQAIAETRSLSYDLTPSVLRDFGFTAGVKEIAQKFSSVNFKIRTKLKNSVDDIEPNLQLFVFRIMQELINNCIKHACATEVVIEVTTAGDFITLVVADNGKGFNQSFEQSLKKGSGLRGIKNRVFLLNGTMEVNTDRGGTEIRVQFNKEMIIADS
ncbi:PAS domain-containing sensor histidine kinase [Pedobacter insulae]|uniref:histidine kinase n=1 Tax=Pedobacter insulae TaxID=414048 RepID=A0A1I2UYG5_9SPHI|nr:PAS domain S-box protein [Pedobacter insulae]SFG82062.1 PAS domain S-box-containing protein [Pedobacter insulae]